MNTWVVDALEGHLGGPVARKLSEDLRGYGPITVVSAREGGSRALIDAVQRQQVDAVVLSGSFAGAYEPDAWISELASAIRAVADDGQIPLLGVCFGHQMLAHALGGEVRAFPPSRRDAVAVRVLVDDPLFEGLPRPFLAAVAHQDHVVRLPEGFQVLAEADHCGVMAIRHRTRPLWGVQFHPDIDAEVLDIEASVRGPAGWEVLRAKVDGCHGPRVLPTFARIAARLRGCG